MLQESGVFRGRTYLIRRDVDLTRDLKDFTICAWISLNYLRGTSNHFLSVGTDNNDEILSGVFENGINGPVIRMKKYHPRINDEVNIYLRRYDFQNYHHYCFMFTSQAQFPYPGGYVNLTNKAYVDGNLVNKEMKTIIKSNYEDIPRFVTVVLGQRLENGRAGSISEESCSGRFADFTIYKGEVSSEDVKLMANCENLSAKSLILEWFVSSYEFVGDVTIEDVPKSSFCKEPALLNNAVFNHGLSHDYAKFVCQKLGGELPTFEEDLSDRRRIYNDLKDSLLGPFPNFTCTVSEDSNTDGRDMEVNLSCEYKTLGSVS